MINSNIKSIDIILNQISYENYSKLRSYRFSSDSLEFDDLDRPLPSEEEEQIWWYKNIITKKHIVLAIEKDNSICGVVNAFSFDNINHCCEIGIEIYPRINFNKGLGKKQLECSLII